MSASLPATPWLQPPDTTGSYLKGYGLGQEAAVAQAHIAAQQNQLQQQAQQTQMELEMRKQQQQKQSLMEQQRLEVEKAYHESQIGLRQQQLQAAAKVADFKVKQAADISAAKMEASQRIANGEDPTDVWMDVGPRAGMSMGGMGALARAKQATIPKELELKKTDTGTFYRSGASEPYHIVPGGTEDKVMAHQPAIEAFKNLGKIEADYRVATKDKDKTELQKQVDAEKRRINEMYQSRNIKAPFPDMVGTSDKKKLDRTNAMWFLNEAKGDKEKARQLAKEAGYEF